MDIAALSVGLSQVKVQQQATLAVMKMAMQAAKANAGVVVELAKTTAPVGRQTGIQAGGSIIDIRV